MKIACGLILLGFLTSVALGADDLIETKHFGTTPPTTIHGTTAVLDKLVVDNDSAVTTKLNRFVIALFDSVEFPKTPPYDFEALAQALVGKTLEEQGEYISALKLPPYKRT